MTATDTTNTVPAAADPDSVTEFVAVTPRNLGGYWGRGATIDEAKQKLRRHGGNLNHVVVFALPPGAVDGHINDMGNPAWRWRSETARLAWHRSPCPVVYRRGVQFESETRIRPSEDR